MRLAVSTTTTQTLLIECGIRYKDNKQRFITENEVIREECITALWRNTGTIAVWISDCIKLLPGESMTVEGSLHVQHVNGVLHVVPIRKIIDTTVRWDYNDIQEVDEENQLQELVLICTDIVKP
jgi:hypothetical protein